MTHVLTRDKVPQGRVDRPERMVEGETWISMWNVGGGEGIKKKKYWILVNNIMHESRLKLGN